MKNTQKYFQLLEKFNAEIDKVQTEAVTELQTRISELETELQPPTQRKKWNDLLLTYKPSDSDLAQASQVFGQVTNMIDPTALTNYGANPNFLFSWFTSKCRDNYLKGQRHEIANAIACALIGKISSGLFVFEPDTLHQQHAYQHGFQFFLDVLMPEQTQAQLSEYAKLNEELTDLKGKLDIVATDHKVMLPAA